MPQSLARIYLHLVFSTKERRPYLSDDTVRAEMHAYLGGTLKGLDADVIAVGGVADHVHLLHTFGRTDVIADMVRDLKHGSSKWVHERFPQVGDFRWQTGYAVFSVSHSLVPQVKRYVQNQAAHHHKKSFQDELREILRKHEMEYDERYVWD
ncbi:MAG TPA: IS200/IS605 family transposase [Candidatus Hydrogenedentes bacterium]|nr:IS200/IS605 family transposase [Candidatus Hydrogenedentota bacterium]HRK33237.1 IS200/IS605 family transposase [Candidatus Hydrogenedentota bacterium]